jgi:hypothetical protein
LQPANESVLVAHVVSCTLPVSEVGVPSTPYAVAAS